MSIRVILDKCTGCKLCVRACPFGAIEIKEKKAVIDLNKCNLCGACVDPCKFKAIELVKETAAKPGATKRGEDVWGFCEQKKNVIQSISWELLAKGRELADKLGMKLCGILLGNKIKDKADLIFERGADKVYLIESPKLAAYQDEPYTEALVKLVKKYSPEVLLCGATTMGRSLISRVAVKLKTGLTADCTGLDIDPKDRLLLQTRPAFGGNIMATIITPNHRPQMATVRHKVMKEAEVSKGRKGELIEENIDDSFLSSRTK